MFHTENKLIHCGVVIINTSAQAMAPPSPVQTKKARGLVAQKAKETIPIETEDYATQFHEIEKDLRVHFMGHVKVYARNMTFEWKEGQNREVASESRSAILRETMRNGIFRHDPTHRMYGVLDRKTFEKHLKDGDERLNVIMGKLKEMTNEALFPTFIAPDSI